MSNLGLVVLPDVAIAVPTGELRLLQFHGIAGEGDGQAEGVGGENEGTQEDAHAGKGKQGAAHGGPFA
jgi:hypothetical protein